MAAQPQGLAQFPVSGKHGGAPAVELPLQASPQLAVQRRQALAIPQAFAVGRVGNHQSRGQGPVRGLAQFIQALDRNAHDF